MLLKHFSSIFSDRIYDDDNDDGFHIDDDDSIRKHNASVWVCFWFHERFFENDVDCAFYTLCEPRQLETKYYKITAFDWWLTIVCLFDFFPLSLWLCSNHYTNFFSFLFSLTFYLIASQCSLLTLLCIMWFDDSHNRSIDRNVNLRISFSIQILPFWIGAKELWRTFDG